MVYVRVKKSVFDHEELLELTVSVLAICLALTLAVGGSNIHDRIFQPADRFTHNFFLFLFAVAPGFVLHELGHKFAALRLGHYARFRSWIGGLFFMFILALFTGFIFAAPGAVYIMMRRHDRKENGIISVAGPTVNILLSLLGFLGLILIGVFGGVEESVSHPGTGIFPSIGEVLVLTVYINAFLAAFNMVPMYPLDGIKIMAWRRDVWVLMIFISLGLLYLIGGGEAISFIITLIIFSFLFNILMGGAVVRGYR